MHPPQASQRGDRRPGTEEHRCEVLIVGGGIAGLSTAMHLARAGVRGVVLIEREPTPGCGASGHNAAIARQLTGRAEHTALTVEGRARLVKAGLLRPTGGVLLAADPQSAELAHLTAEARAFAVAVEAGEGSPLAGLNAAAHLRVPGDGAIDAAGLLAYCAREARRAGVELRFGHELVAAERVGAGWEAWVRRRTPRAGSGGGPEPMRAGVIVNAAGAWAGPLGTMLGGHGPLLRPLRRHLVWSRRAWPAGGPGAGGPWAWWVDRPLYLRPESGGVLACPCDEVEVTPPGRGEQPEVDDAALVDLAASLLELAPGLVDLTVDRMWAGIRTFAPDRRFRVGWAAPGVVEVAGLGGHGMTAGLAVGALAARILGG